MNLIDSVFDRMDAWRHLPNYQLERRADLFFSLYLAEALEDRLGFAVDERLVPEFPVRIGTIYPDVPIDKSYKIDYLALSAAGDKAVLVELKTEALSRRAGQDTYLLAARQAGLAALLGGVLDIFRATQSKRKYFALIELLESMGQLRIPDQVRHIMARPVLQGLSEASRGIDITTRATDAVVVYVQPSAEGDDIISFDQFREVVGRHDDPLSRRFARCLAEWSSVRTGNTRKERSL